MERSLYGSLSTVAGPLHDCRGSEWATLRVTFVLRTPEDFLIPNSETLRV